jgi:hypothetical protein
VLALSLDDARNAAIAVVIVFLVGSIAAVWVMKTIVQKLATTFVLLLLAFAVYTQRTSLQDCADKVQGNFAREGTSVTVTDTDCSFFGMTITVSDPRNDAGSE